MPYEMLMGHWSHRPFRDTIEYKSYNDIHKAAKADDTISLKKILMGQRDTINSETNSGKTALYLACENGCLNSVQMLVDCLECDVNLPDYNYFTPLHVACVTRNFPIIELLIKGRCLVNVEDYYGYTPAHVLFISEYCRKRFGTRDEEIGQILAYFLVNGADISRSNSLGNTPLHFACSKGHPKCAKLLLEANNNAQINACNKFGHSPLMLAVEAQNILIVRYLLSQGADANIIDRRGWTALHLACEGESIQILRLIVQHCTVREPEDMLKLLELGTGILSIKQIRFLLPLSPYFRPSHHLMTSPILLIQRIKNVLKPKVQSLASHCRSVVRRHLNEKLSSTPSLVRREILNLDVPEYICRYLCYEDDLKEKKKV